MGGPGAAAICGDCCSTGLRGTGVGGRVGGREWVPREGSDPIRIWH